MSNQVFSKKLLYTLVTILLYILLFLWLGQYIGEGVAVFAILPTIVGGWLFGIRGGLAVTLLLNTLNIVLFILIRVPDIDNPLEAIPSILTGIAAGLAAGWIKKLLDQLQEQSQQLAKEQEILNEQIAERKRVEVALREAQNELERRVQKRTAELSKTNQTLQSEIKERREAELALQAATQEIKSSLEEKEFLLQEVHHRVKNNLQIVSSLLYLQTNAAEDPKVIALLQDSQHRIRSMAIIHETLYRSKNLGQIDLAEYVRGLVNYLFHAYGAIYRGITFNFQANDILVSIDKAVPCGLIVNELVSNTLKHAFPQDQGGQVDIEIGLNDNQDKITLKIADNGVGFPAGINFQKTNSLGLLLVNTLVNQLKGTITLNNSGGAEFVITFTAKDRGKTYDSNPSFSG